MYVQSGDISSIKDVLQGHVRQTDMLIILGDFTGLSQSEGICILHMLHMILMYEMERLALLLGFLSRCECRLLHKFSPDSAVA